MKKILGNPSETNKKLVSLIERIKINNFYLENRKDFRDQILNDVKSDDEVLDIGKAMRDKHKKIVCKNLETLDVNDFVYSISGGTATLSSTTPSSISIDSNSSIKLGVELNGIRIGGSKI